MAASITTVAIRYEQDVVLARQRTRQIARELGFDMQDQTRLATAVSEVARNAFSYAGGGKVEFSIEGATAPQILLIRVIDDGPGIANLKEILEGDYKSPSGMGLGLIGARRLVDHCEIHTGPGGGTEIVLKKLLSRRVPFVTHQRVGEIAGLLALQRPEGPFDEIKRQNQELLRALDEARERQDELARVNQELEDTNRGVVALYAELDERADHLRQADEMKTSFLSNMSHEFRTPLNSILALSQILLERTDGELTSEQEIQVGFIRKGAESLLEMVNDLLDLAKIEAGKIDVQPVQFAVANLFSALRGMLRPLLVGESVRLVFEEPGDVPVLFADENKVSQVLRNFIANALKFTERGEVRVSVQWHEAEQTVRFAVADTGIGIAAADREKIFEEFTQLANPAQRRFKGTGLGLPLCRKLAGLMGGRIELTSELGIGSTFALVLPITQPGVETAAASQAAVEEQWRADENRVPVLFLDDEPEMLLVYEAFLRGSPFQMISALTLPQARSAVARARPRALVLDILVRGKETWKWLAELKNDAETRAMPVLVATQVEDEGKGYALGADEYHVKPLAREVLLASLRRLTGIQGEQDEPPIPDGPDARKRVLIIDDQDSARYVLAKLLDQPRYLVCEAKNGVDGLRMAKEAAPDFIFLDLDMPDVSGFDVLAELKASPLTRSIPVAIVTSLSLTEANRARLEQASAVLNKTNLSRADIEQALMMKPTVARRSSARWSGNPQDQNQEQP